MQKMMIQIIKFGIVGVLCFLIDYGVMVFLTEICRMNYLLSSTISFSVSVVVNYILSVCYVFNKRQKKGKRSFFLFFIFSVVGLGLNAAIMWGMVDLLEVYYMISKIVATGIVMVYNFVTRKLLFEKKQ